MLLFLSVKLLSFFFIIFSIISGMMSSSVLSMWFFLELSTISFMFNLMFTKHSSMFKETMKLFLIQSLSGMSILLLLLNLESSFSNSISFLIWMIMLFKMSAVPFHTWFLNLSNKMSWESMLLFLTALKFIPLLILSTSSTNYSVFFSVLSFLVASVSSVFYSSMKNLMVLSSLYFLGMIFYSMNISNFWFEMMLIYTLMFFPLFFILSNSNNMFFLSNWVKGSSTLIIFMMIISLAGLPPFPGFFLKYIWLVESKIDFFSLVIFFISSSFMMYLYISFAMKNLLEISKQLFTSNFFMKMNFFLLWVFLLPAYISVYLCF